MNEIAPAGNTALSAYRLAAGMLWHDRHFLLPLLLILFLPTLIETFYPSLSIDTAIAMLVVQRLSQLLFLWIVGRRWIDLLVNKSSTSGPTPATLHFFALGLGGWLLLMVPILLQFGAKDDQLKFVGLISLIPLVVLWLRYYFYLLPAFFGVKEPRSVFGMAGDITARNRRAPFLTLIAPFGAVALVCGLIYAFSPDGRVAAAHYAATIVAELFWPLTCYLWLAFGFTLVAEPEWHKAKLDPYREGRFNTISIAAPQFLSKLLTARNGLKMIVIAALIWIANRFQLEALPPAPSIQIVQAVAEEDKVKLTLKLKDEVYHFRGFHPVYLALAGEERHPISVEIEKVESPAGDQELLFQIPLHLSELDMTLTYRTNRSADALRSLEDLHLWYRYSKLQKVKVQ